MVFGTLKCNLKALEFPGEYLKSMWYMATESK
jgi:hypothetical protein